MPIGVVASTHTLHEDWEPREKDLKTYIHFDRHIPLAELKKSANNPDLVARNAFFPLLRFFETWTKFRKNNIRTTKSRPLRFACRKDAAIYARYRSLLSTLYEAELTSRNLGDVPVAYRRLPKAGGGKGNKSNIEIAKEVFDFVRSEGDWIVTVVDIKSYFESLDHARIRSVWEFLLGASLPKDHEAIFRAITRYSIVDVEKAFARLQLAQVGTGANRAERRMRKIDKIRRSGFAQICSPHEFRQMIGGGDPQHPSLIQSNGFDFGIPQGTPISDLIANFYLIDFDTEINHWVTSLGGMYRRYSDDIIVVLPRSNVSDDLAAKRHLQIRIKAYGKHLRIQDKKVSVVLFEAVGGAVNFTHIFGKASRNGLEYLGFEFDGSSLKIKNSTLSNAWRKLKRRAYGYASRYVKRYRAKGTSWMAANFPFKWLQKELLKNVTYSQDVGYDTWTFVKYVRRASRSFSGYNRKFSRQTRKYRHLADVVIKQAFDRALEVHA